MSEDEYEETPECQGCHGDAPDNYSLCESCDAHRAEWLADLERFAAQLDRTLEPWQLELAAEVFASQLEPGSITGRGDIWVAAHLAGSRVGRRFERDGRLNEWGNWPR